MFGLGQHIQHPQLPRKGVSAVLDSTGNSSFQLQKHLSVFSLISQLCLSGTPAQDCGTWGVEFPNPILKFCSFPPCVGSASSPLRCDLSIPCRGGFTASPRDRQTVGKLLIQGIFHLWEPGRGIMQSEWKLWFWGFWLQHRRENKHFGSKVILNENRSCLCWKKMTLRRAAGQIFLLYLILEISDKGVWYPDWNMRILGICIRS